ncbi:DUF6969 family protein [Rhodocyclaceae bacterium SMB388]
MTTTGAPLEQSTTLPALERHFPDPAALSAVERRRMLEAGREALECRRVLSRGGLNIVGEVLRGQGEFYEMQHYPRDDVFDETSRAQYYYHAHRGPVEHGHFHCFLRAGNLPDGAQPVDWPNATEKWPEGDDAISHLVAISMDAWGEPIGLFATNRWVTDETWYAADDVILMLDRFEIDHAAPSWPVNRWLGAMLRLYRPWIVALLRHRDEVVAMHRQAHPEKDILEDRTLEITGYLPISIQDTLDMLDAGSGDPRRPADISRLANEG